MIWAAVAWPLLAGAISVILFNRRITPFEAIVLVLAPLGTLWYLNGLGREIGTTDVEYLTAPLASATHHRAWTERVECRHEEKTESGTRKKHDYDKVKHKERWYAEDTDGRKIPITEEHFDKLCKHFRSKEKVRGPDNMVENLTWISQVTRWSGEDSDLLAATTPHEYINRIPASHSVYTYEEVDRSEFRLYNYPEIENFYEAPALLGVDDPEASRRLDILNARLGPKKQVRAMILVYIDKPREAALAQEAYWQGGNKNEFIICIGVDYKKDVKWSHVFSWTEREDLKIDARNVVADQKEERLDLGRVLDWLEENLERFERKSFSEFDYLNVTPPYWFVMLSHLLVLLVTGLWFYWAVIKPDRK